MKKDHIPTRHKAIIACLTVVLGFMLFGGASVEAASQTDRKLSQCLKKAAQSPDVAIAEAESWMKKGGGDRALLCHAYAQFHRGEYSLAGSEFSALAAKSGNRDRAYLTSLHVKAGLAYSRADDHVNAEQQYTKALYLEKQDPDIWMDRAAERASIEKYWDAIDDLNYALTLMPDMTEALRLRGQAWLKLGQEHKAWADLQRAAVLDSAEGGVPQPTEQQEGSIPAQ